MTTHIDLYPTTRETFEADLLAETVHCSGCNKDVTPDLQYWARYHCYDLLCPLCMAIVDEVDAPEPIEAAVRY